MRSITAIVFALICGATVALVAPGGALADLLKAGDMAPQFSTGAIYGEQTTPIKFSGSRQPRSRRSISTLRTSPRDARPKRAPSATVTRRSRRLGSCCSDAASTRAIPIARSSRSTACRSRCCSILDKKIATETGVANGIAKYDLDGRVTYVIGGDGRILKVYPKVDPALNASQIISQFGSGKSTAVANSRPSDAATALVAPLK